jgi:indolepyruvate ferredoxin oxidoreductase
VLPNIPTTAPEREFGILIAGIGGTGVITVGEMLGMAAHLDGLGCTVLDQSGLAQKYGAVTSHVRFGPDASQLHSARLDVGAADLVIACDLVVAGGRDSLLRMRPGRTRVVINQHETPTSDFVRNPRWRFPGNDLRADIAESAGADHVEGFAATEYATRLLGNALAANLLLVGFALQKGWLPLSVEAVLRAIELNGVSVEPNQAAILWGRRCAVWPERVHRLAYPPSMPAAPGPGGERAGDDINDVTARWERHLAAYQDRAYAKRYRRLVDRVMLAESKISAEPLLAMAVARNFGRLLAYKDEYEVARLYTAREFKAAIAEHFDGPYRVAYHLAPPLLSRRDPVTGQPLKRRFGPWLGAIFPLLARLRFLRGTVFDPFGHTAERRTERRLAREYEQRIESILDGLSVHNVAVAVEIAALPDMVRGFGHIKLANIERMEAKLAPLVERLRPDGNRPVRLAA